MKRPQDKVQVLPPAQAKNAKNATAPVVKEVKPFNINDYVKDGITKDEVLEFKTAYDIFDTNGTGRVEVADIKEAFLNLGFHHQSKFALILLQQLEKRDGGVLDFGEFIRIATARISEDFTKPQTDLVFSAFDPSAAGKISLYQFTDTVRDLGEDISNEQIEKIFRTADADNDKSVTTEDFYNIVTKKVFK